MDGGSCLLPLVRRLSRHSKLSDSDRKAIASLPFRNQKLDRGTYLVREGERPNSSRLVVSGFVYRHKFARDGARQIVSIHIPGEIVDLHNSFLSVADHNVQALTKAEVAIIPRSEIKALNCARPAVANAFLVETLINASILQEWVLNIGRRDSLTRLAHLFCELSSRLKAAGLIEDDRWRVPMTQEEIADALGITQVHLNRMLGSLSEKRLINRDKGSVIISNSSALAAAGDFHPRYLHLDDAEAP